MAPVRASKSPSYGFMDMFLIWLAGGCSGDGDRRCPSPRNAVPAYFAASRTAVVLVEVLVFIVLRPDLCGELLDGVLLDQPGPEQRFPALLAAPVPLHGPVA